MSIFTKLAGAAMSSMTGGDKDSKSGMGMQMVMELMQNSSGGVSGLIQNLTSGGIANQVNSWVGSGDNEAVDPEGLGESLGSDTINQLASKFGVEPALATQLLSSALPEVINKLTPGGQVEEEGNMQSGLSSLLGMLK